MTDPLEAAEARLVDALADTARGPRRNGLFALWLVTRAAAGVLPPDAVSDRRHGERLDAMTRRLSSLSIPAPLRRALAGARRELADASPRGAERALHLLVTPAREVLGPDAGDAMTLALRDARHAAETAAAG